MKNIILSPIPLKNILVIFLTSLIGSFLIGVFFVVLGASYAGNYYFPNLGTLTGYEAGGIFFGIIGIYLGALFGVMIVLKLYGNKTKNINLLIVAAILICLSLLYENYFEPAFISIIIISAISMNTTAIIFITKKKEMQ